MGKLLTLLPGRPVTADIATAVFRLVTEAKANTFPADGLLETGAHVISSDGDVNVEITVFADGRIVVYEQ